MADIRGQYQDTDGARIGGLTIKKFTSIPGKKEEDKGKLQIILEADKDEINTGAYTLGDVLKAMDVHQTGRQPIVLRVLMPTDVVADPARLASRTLPTVPTVKEG